MVTIRDKLKHRQNALRGSFEGIEQADGTTLYCLKTVLAEALV